MSFPKMFAAAALLVTGLLTTASEAHAGFGATASLSSLSDGTAWYPSLDYRQKKFVVQVHALELIGGLPADTINFGVDGAYVVQKVELGNGVDGVVQAGAGFRLLSDTGFDNPTFNFVAKTRMGAELKKGGGFGIYAVPTIGVSSIVTGDATLTYGGGLEVSFWLK